MFISRPLDVLRQILAPAAAPFFIYVPEDLVPEIQRCLDKGRALQELLFEVAPRYVQALKREKNIGKRARELTGVASDGAANQFCGLGIDATGRARGATMVPSRM
jgi:hypothetical protein